MIFLKRYAKTWLVIWILVEMALSELSFANLKDQYGSILDPN